MERIGVNDFGSHASRYIALVKAGETVAVTEHGVLVALLTPPGGAPSTRDRLVVAGRLIPATNPTGRLRSPRPVPVAAGEATNQELLDGERPKRQ